MNKRPGHVDVTTEVGYCNFCQRTRNLRREQHHLGQLVRTIVACETCHRTLSSTMGVAQAIEPAQEQAPAVEATPVVAEEPKPPRRAPAKRATTAKAKPAAKPAAKTGTKTPSKPRSTATRQTSKKK